MSCGDAPSRSDSPTRPSTASSIPHPKQEPIIRVRLLREESSDSVVDIGESDQHIHLLSAREPRTFTGPIRVQRSSSHWIIHDSSDEPPWEGDRMVSLELSADKPLQLVRAESSRRYAGTLHCIPSADADSEGWELIEYIGMERYLPGVLAAELYAGWNEDCYAAQCVAARSFACMRIAQRTHHTYDVTDGPSTQAYHGVVENDTAHDAQSLTTGIILSWNGHLVPGYFSSCCGGRAATAVDAIGPSPVNDIPPLMGHGKDDYCHAAPLYDWSINRSSRTLGRRLSRYGKSHGLDDLESITTVQEIQVAERNTHGRPVRLKVIDRSRRHATISTGEFLRASNFAGSMGRPTKALWSGWGTGESSRGRIELRGHGFGHGVGLCQYGAEAMGREGHSWREIIDWYFPDVTLHQAW
jgi:stage II sporulation protein D